MVNASTAAAKTPRNNPIFADIAMFSLFDSTSLCLSVQAEIQTRSGFQPRDYAPRSLAFRSQSQVQAAWGGFAIREPIHPTHDWRLGQFSGGVYSTLSACKPLPPIKFWLQFAMEIGADVDQRGRQLPAGFLLRRRSTMPGLGQTAMFRRPRPNVRVGS